MAQGAWIGALDDVQAVELQVEEAHQDVIGVVPLTSSAAVVLLVVLKLDKLEFGARLRHSLQVLLGDGEVDISNVKTMEGNRVGVVARGLSRSDLAVLFGPGSSSCAA